MVRGSSDRSEVPRRRGQADHAAHAHSCRFRARVLTRRGQSARASFPVKHASRASAVHRVRQRRGSASPRQAERASLPCLGTCGRAWRRLFRRHHAAGHGAVLQHGMCGHGGRRRNGTERSDCRKRRGESRCVSRHPREKRRGESRCVSRHPRVAGRAQPSDVRALSG